MITLATLLCIACAQVVRRELQLRRLLRTVKTAVAQSQSSAELVTQATNLLEERTAAFNQLQAKHMELDQKYLRVLRQVVHSIPDEGVTTAELAQWPLASQRVN